MQAHKPPSSTRCRGASVTQLYPESHGLLLLQAPLPSLLLLPTQQPT
jgi:hypothetical protein